MCGHLVVLQHGIGGHIEDLSKISAALDAAFPGRLECVVSYANDDQIGGVIKDRIVKGGTNDGVKAGGARLAHLIKEKTKPAHRYLSCVGHSLGGIYCRQALQVLEEENWFSTCGIQPVNFVTLASPHLGITEIQSYYRGGIWVCGCYLGETVRDLALNSDVVDNLSNETAIRALGRFERRAVYGNLDDDMWVRVCSALIVSAPPIMEGKLDAGVPKSVLAGDGSMELRSFPKTRHAVVRRMLSRLSELSWERYCVHFPRNGTACA